MTKHKDIILEQIEQELLALDYEKNLTEISTSQENRLAILNLCSELLNRTSPLISKFQELSIYGDIDKVSDFTNYNPLADFVYAIATRRSPISLRDLMSYILTDVRWGPENMTQQKIAQNADVRQATISDYITGKVSMTADNYEKVINATLKIKTAMGCL